MLREFKNIPNVLTLFRIVSILPIIILIQNHFYILAFIILLLAQFSDFLDGQIARKTNCVTSLGSLMDPFADKIFIISFLSFFTIKGLLNSHYFYISSTRDILQLLAIPILISYKKIAFKVQPTLLPKIATAIKYVIISTLSLSMIITFNTKIALLPLLILSIFFEIYILATFFLRFLKIYRGQQTAFE